MKNIKNFLEKEGFCEEAFNFGYENALSTEMGEEIMEREEVEERISSLASEAASRLACASEVERIRDILLQSYSSGEEVGNLDS